MPLILFKNQILIILCELEPFLMKFEVKSIVKFLKIYEISEKVKGFLSHVV